MAPKRSAPPPAPPAASSEETVSGSGSEESEEEIAPASPTHTSKNPPPPPQKGEESETSDEEEEESDEEPTHANPPSAPKNLPPPPRKGEESDTSGEDEEEEGESSESESESDKALPPKPAPKQEAEGKDLKPSSSGEAKKPAVPFNRTWSTDDEVRILEALAAHRREHGALPQPDALVAALAGSLDKRGYGRKELQGKVQHLKRRYDTAAKKGELPTKDHDRRLFNLSKSVWGGDKAADTAAGAVTANSSGRREFGEMCELYPYLAEEVKALEAAQPGLFKREFGRIDDDKARALDVKIKKQRLVQMKVELRRGDLTKEVTRALMELVE